MIIKLKGADFSTNNINTLLNNWFISLSLGSGAASSNPATSVAKGAAYSNTITIADNYELGSAGVTATMGGTAITPTISGNTITISIASVTGNVIIKVPTVNTSTGEESGGSTGEESGGESVPTVTTWYQNATSDGTTTLEANSGGTGPYYYYNNANYVGKVINAFRAQSNAGSSTINYGTTDGSTFTEIGTFTISEANTYEIVTVPEFTVPSGNYIWFTGEFNYSQTQPDSAFWFKSKGGGENKMNLGIDVGYITSDPSSGGSSTPTTTSWYLEAVEGYTLSNGADNSKYYYTNNEKYAGKTINALKIVSKTAGTFNYGTFDGSNYSDALVATVSAAGTQIINIPPLTFGENDHFWVQASTTGVFCYGTTNDEPDLYFTRSNGNLNQLNLGISLGYVVE